MKIPYTNFTSLINPVRKELHRALDEVLDSSRYILGPNLLSYEQKVASFLGTQHVLGVANGTCALRLVLKQLGIGQGDEVITVPNSFIASASSIALTGATPRFVDVGDDMNMDPDALEAGITSRTRAIIPVHLTGRSARMPEIMEIARRHNLIVLEDCAQAIGAKLNGKSVGSWGNAAAFSCHPLKNLFAYGDSGMIATNDSELYQIILMARSHGMPNRDTCNFWSHNCRMDELQAAFLLVNFTQFPEWTEARRRLAMRYNDALRDIVKVPDENPGEYHVYQTYMIRAERRDELQEYLRSKGIEALIHYKIPIHMQPAAASLGYRLEDFPMTKTLSETILSLPLYPSLSHSEQDYVVQNIRNFFC